MTGKRPDANAVQSVNRAVQILMYLGEAGEDRPLTRIAADLGLNVSTTHRLLATLLDKGFIEQNPYTSHYRLGLSLIHLGEAVLDRLDYRQEAVPFLRELMLRTGETANLVVLDRHEAVYIDRVESKASLRMFSRIGHRAPVHATAVGKVLVSELEDDARRALLAEVGLPRLTPNTISSMDAFCAELERVRSRGYAVDDEECEPGARCVAAPVRNHKGAIVCAISVSGPVTRITRKDISGLAAIVQDVARRLSRRLGLVAQPSACRNRAL